MTPKRSNKEKVTLAGIFTAAAGGAYTLVTGLFSPTWLIGHTGLWYPISTTFASFIGPRVAPNVPWKLLLAGASVLFIIALLVKTYRNRNTTQA